MSRRPGHCFVRWISYPDEPPERRWQRLTAGPLSPRLPFAAHQWAFDRVFADWDETRGPRPAWTPRPEETARTNLAALLRERGLQRYQDLHAWSVQDRAGFWRWAVERLGIHFVQPPRQILDDGAGPEFPRWLVGARYNIVASCFLADPGTPALVWAGPGGPDGGADGDADGKLRSLSYGQLSHEVGRVAAALTAAGFQPGDAIAIDMPMTPESVMIYLGIVAAGMAVVSVADSLAPDEVATRLRIAGRRGCSRWTAFTGVARRCRCTRRSCRWILPRTIVLGATDPGAEPPGLRPGIWGGLASWPWRRPGRRWTRVRAIPTASPTSCSRPAPPASRRPSRGPS